MKLILGRSKDKMAEKESTKVIRDFIAFKLDKCLARHGIVLTPEQLESAAESSRVNHLGLFLDKETLETITRIFDEEKGQENKG